MSNIRGLTYIENFITEDDEKYFIDNINNCKWNTENKKRIQYYGYKYPYKNTRELITTTPIPNFLKVILDKVNQETNKKIDQIIINEYIPGQGIFPHIDNMHLFSDTIIILSLQSNIIMDFMYFNKYEELKLDKQSIVILQTDARYRWRYSITPRKFDNKIKRNTRISITFKEKK